MSDRKTILRTFIAFFLLFPAFILHSQELRMTFKASGASSAVDSVKAINLRTYSSVSLPGNDTLVLEMSTGINDQADESDGIVYPNPCSGKAMLIVYSGMEQTGVFSLVTLSGQELSHSSTSLHQGNNLFQVTLAKTGVYLLSLRTGRGSSAYKIICTETGEEGNTIRFRGMYTGDPGYFHLKDLNVYKLAFNSGDIILYRCRGGVNTTIITDSPLASKTYQVEFVPCADPAGRNYAVVKIGNQTWMAENLAWLPRVMPSDTGAENLKFYYVYAYQDTIVSSAKKSPDYIAYGVLYNWPAAMNLSGKRSSCQAGEQAVCPSGWHLPSDEEWKTLEMSLGMTQADADTMYLRMSGDVGMKLKATMAWPEDTLTSNFSGFTAFPGGYRNTHGSFDLKLHNALFWTSTSLDTMSWYHCFDFNDRGVYRMTTLWSQGLSVRCVKDQ